MMAKPLQGRQKEDQRKAKRQIARMNQNKGES
jgi:hypothetical protein